jgi:hypothetical protein
LVIHGARVSQLCGDRSSSGPYPGAAAIANVQSLRERTC